MPRHLNSVYRTLRHPPARLPSLFAVLGIAATTSALTSDLKGCCRLHQLGQHHHHGQISDPHGHPALQVAASSPVGSPFDSGEEAQRLQPAIKKSGDRQQGNRTSKSIRQGSCFTPFAKTSIWHRSVSVGARATSNSGCETGDCGRFSHRRRFCLLHAHTQPHARQTRHRRLPTGAQTHQTHHTSLSRGRCGALSTTGLAFQALSRPWNLASWQSALFPPRPFLA